MITEMNSLSIRSKKIWYKESKELSLSVKLCKYLGKLHIAEKSSSHNKILTYI